MKRIALCAVLLLLFSFPVTAEQIDDSFYTDHSEQCQYVNRVYTVNEPVPLYQNPESQLLIGTAQTGEEIVVTYIYTDPQGKQWGICGQYDYPYGWFCMDGLTPIFDSEAFRQANSSKIIPEEGTLDPSYTGQTVIFREYPGSERVRGSSTVFEGNPPGYTEVYTDAEGRRWGYVTNYFGHKNCWICLDEPAWDPGQAGQAPAAEEEKGISAHLFAGVLIMVTAIGFVLIESKKRNQK